MLWELTGLGGALSIFWAFWHRRSGRWRYGAEVTVVTMIYVLVLQAMKHWAPVMLDETRDLRAPTPLSVAVLVSLALFGWLLEISRQHSGPAG